MEILRVENLTKTYGSGEAEVRALDDVSFSVEKGEFIAIIGPSGSGKSTLPLLLDQRKADKGQLSELLSTLNLADRRKHLPNQLSGGQQQRVSIGRALVNNPALMLADEPTGNLDSANSADIVRLLRLSNQKYNQTLILITHDQNIALQADRILSIEDGRIAKDEVIRK